MIHDFGYLAYDLPQLAGIYEQGLHTRGDYIEACAGWTPLDTPAPTMFLSLTRKHHDATLYLHIPWAPHHVDEQRMTPVLLSTQPIDVHEVLDELLERARA